MKLIKVLFLAAFVGLMIAACTKEKIVTKKVLVNTAPDSLGLILAGDKGSSRSWGMTKATISINNGAAQTISLGLCLADNVYKFTNNSTQDYIQTEGPNKCNSADSTITENGNWAFTSDGKSLIVLGSWYDDISAESEFLLPLTALGKELTVVSLTDTTLVIRFSFTDQGTTSTTTYTYTVTFTKIS